MIDTHQELVLALAEAAELEHSLICQYLFAAYSLKTDPIGDGVSPGDAGRFSTWQNRILDIARQEMGHLGTVWNLAALTGAFGNWQRANFPQASAQYYPPAIGFALEAFGEASLARFVAFERPMPPPAEEIAAVAPDPLAFSRVGDLYRQIRTCVASLADADLLVQTNAAQDSASWANNVMLRTATTRDGALAAIDFIIQQGEGSLGHSEHSHFGVFMALTDELRQHRDGGGVDPARACVANPATQKHRDALDAVVIDHPNTVRAVDLFNLMYGALLHLLRQYYSFAGETDDQRLFLRNAAYRTMHGGLGPLARDLTRMPAWRDGRHGSAGPSFEIYGVETLDNKPEIAWHIIGRRLRTAQAEAADLAHEMPSFAATLTALAEAAASIAEILETGLLL